jgi:uncharacterized protein DUF1501
MSIGPWKIPKDKSEEFARKFPHHHQTLFNRPNWTRRQFFEIAGAGIVGSYLAQRARAAGPVITSQNMATRNTAKNCIFVLLTGAISVVDTFDLKVTSGVTPTNFTPTMINGINWPAGLLPKLGQQLPNVAIVRSMSAWALVHSLAQTWSQIGRNPAAALGNIAPNIGSVVAIEKDPQRLPGQVFPTFVALNSPSGAGQGYFPATYAPFRVGEPTTTTSTGIPDTTNPNGQTTFNTMYQRLHQYDDALRLNSPYGQPLQDYNAFYLAAQGMMYNSAVQQAFGFSATDSARYGSSPFGNACLVAKQILAANQGTRFVQISYGSWDMHQDIYGIQNPKGNNMYTMSPSLDNGVAALLGDLKASGALDETLVVMVGEFGRTPGISAAGGRDHYLIQSAVFAGAGIKGGKTIGTTSSDGSTVTDYGWNGSGTTGPRYARPEDIESTIYSAMGIDWTTTRYDDPFGRGFEYVPFASQGSYGPINELWS